MDLEAPRDEVLAQKDQANTAFLLHGYGLALKSGDVFNGVVVRTAGAQAHRKSPGVRPGALHLARISRKHIKPLSMATVHFPNPNGILSSSPGLRPRRYPGKGSPTDINPNGVAANRLDGGVWPQPRWGCENQLPPSQGRRGAPTLGSETQSLWDCQSGRMPSLQNACKVQRGRAHSRRRRISPPLLLLPTRCGWSFGHSRAPGQCADAPKPIQTSTSGLTPRRFISFL